MSDGRGGYLDVVSNDFFERCELTCMHVGWSPRYSPQTGCFECPFHGGIIGGQKSKLLSRICIRIAEWPKAVELVFLHSAAYMNRAQEILIETGCMSKADSQNYEAKTRQREKDFLALTAGNWACRATMGGREFWKGERKWVFQERYVESYMSLPNGNTLIVIVGLPNENILHLEPRVEERNGQQQGRVFIDMLDAAIVHLSAKSLRLSVTAADRAAYFSPVGGEVVCSS